jgi:hypothetical protein
MKIENNMQKIIDFAKENLWRVYTFIPHKELPEVKQIYIENQDGKIVSIYAWFSCWYKIVTVTKPSLENGTGREIGEYSENLLRECMESSKYPNAYRNFAEKQKLEKILTFVELT